jgi:hypothetical protein
MPTSTSWFAALRDRVGPRPLPAAGMDRVVYGLTQPLLGVRVLVTHRHLLRAAAVPAALLAAVCVVIALLGHRGAFLHRFYTTFVILAPVPSVLFARHYARLAVEARHTFGFARAEPCLESLHRSFERAVKQAILTAIALAPVTALLYAVPVVGWMLVKVAAALWALHWVVVEAFDSARVLRPGETLADLDAAALRVRSPWYVRWLFDASAHAPVAGGLIHRFARLCDRLSVPWREEIALVEEHPALMVGFALSTAAVLAIPILDLAFRPIVIIAASHIIGQLELTAGHHQAPSPSSPVPPSPS